MSFRAGILKDKLLEGVSEHYCRHFAVVQWGVTKACARRYVHFAKKLIGASVKPYTQDLFLDALATRKHLFMRACATGDYKLAHEIAKDEAELLSLYDVKKKPLSPQHGTSQNPVVVDILTNSASSTLFNPESKSS